MIFIMDSANEFYSSCFLHYFMSTNHTIEEQYFSIFPGGIKNIELNIHQF